MNGYRKTHLNVLCALQVFKAMDQNADGFISREEFVKAFEPNLELPKHPTADDLIAAARWKKTEKVSPAQLNAARYASHGLRGPV